MSYAPGAPETVWALDIPAGAKLTLLRLWSWADHEDQREYRACTVWTKAREGLTPAQALRGTLADQTGQTERAVRQHLTKLRALGLADASGRCVALTPGWRGCHLRGTDDTTASDTTASRGDTAAASGDTSTSSRDTTASLQLNPPVPPTPPSPGEERATSPAPSESTSPNGVTYGHDDARRADRPNPTHAEPLVASLPHHAREALDRARGQRPAPEPDTLAQRIAAVSQAAAYQLAAGSPKWPRDMAGFQLSTGVSDDEMVAMFVHWESAPRPKPPMDKLFWSSGGGRAWLDRHFGLGKAAPALLTDAPSSEDDAFWAAAKLKAANS